MNEKQDSGPAMFHQGHVNLVAEIRKACHAAMEKGLLGADVIFALDCCLEAYRSGPTRMMMQAISAQAAKSAIQGPTAQESMIFGAERNLKA